MDRSYLVNIPFVQSVFHPSDFTAASENAFAHALAIGLQRKTEFIILHAGGSKDVWTRFPSVRTTLERWGMLESGSARSAVFDELQLRVKKVDIETDRPLKTILDYLKKRGTDLIVLATEGREGLPRWIRPSMAEKIAERTKTMTLFVPSNGRGFVSLKNGSICLRRVLLPVDHEPTPIPPIEYVARVARLMKDPLDVILLHVGDEAAMPAFPLPNSANCVWRRQSAEGDVVDTIVQAAEEHNVDLIAMATAGHQGFLDALRGSVTEQVLRRSPCPLLAVPAID